MTSDELIDKQGRNRSQPAAYKEEIYREGYKDGEHHTFLRIISFLEQQQMKYREELKKSRKHVKDKSEAAYTCAELVIDLEKMRHERTNE